MLDKHVLHFHSSTSLPNHIANLFTMSVAVATEAMTQSTPLEAHLMARCPHDFYSTPNFGKRRMNDNKWI